MSVLPVQTRSQSRQALPVQPRAGQAVAIAAPDDRYEGSRAAAFLDRANQVVERSPVLRAVAKAGLGLGEAALRVGDAALNVGGAVLVGGMYAAHAVGKLGVDRCAALVPSRMQAGARMALRSLAAGTVAGAAAAGVTAALGGNATFAGLYATQFVALFTACGAAVIERPEGMVQNPDLIRQRFPVK